MTLRAIPRSIWALGLVSLLMDTSSETAFGVFNLVSGGAMLAASVLAGWLWDQYGAPATFYAGAGFTAVALLGLSKHLTGRRQRA